METIEKMTQGEWNNIFHERVMGLFETMTQTQISKLTGISQSKISEIINSSTLKKKLRPSAELVYKIAKAFNVSTDYLFGLTEVSEPANSTIDAIFENGYRCGCDEMKWNLEDAVKKMKRAMNEILGEVEG